MSSKKQIYYNAHKDISLSSHDEYFENKCKIIQVQYIQCNLTFKSYNYFWRFVSINLHIFITPLNNQSLGKDIKNITV